MNKPSLQDFYASHQASIAASGHKTKAELAGPWARISAALLNLLLILLVITPALVAIFPCLFNSHDAAAKYIDIINSRFSILVNMGIGITLLLTPAVLIWQTVWMSRRGQSIGKRIVGIKVVHVNGHNAGFAGTVLLREVVYGLISLFISSMLGGAILRGLGFIGNMLNTAGKLENGSLLGLVEHYHTLLDLLAYLSIIIYLPTIICVLMLFRRQSQRRTLQDYLAQTLVIKT